MSSRPRAAAICMALAVFTWASTSSAQTIQPPEVLSALGEPLRVQVRVAGASALAARWPTRDERETLNAPPPPAGIGLAVRGTSIWLTSVDPVREPVLVLPVVVTVDGRENLRVLDVLLEPPPPLASGQPLPRRQDAPAVAPGAAYGPVAPGETLNDLAQRAGVAAAQRAQFLQQLRALNPRLVTDEGWLIAGSVLTLPRGVQARPATVGQAAAAQQAASIFDPRGDNAPPAFQLAAGASIDWAAVNAQGPREISIEERIGSALNTAGTRLAESAERAKRSRVALAAEQQLAETQFEAQQAAQLAGERISAAVAQLTGGSVVPVDTDRSRAVAPLRAISLETYAGAAWLRHKATWGVVAALFALTLIVLAARRLSRPVSGPVSGRKGSPRAQDADRAMTQSWSRQLERRANVAGVGEGDGVQRARSDHDLRSGSLRARLHALRARVELSDHRDALLVAEAHLDFGQFRTADDLVSAVAKAMNRAG